MFGHRWISNFGEKDDGTWLEGLRGLTPKDLANGLRKTINANEEWPPSLPIFRNHCLDVTEEGVKSYAEVLVKKELGSHIYKTLTMKDIEKRIKAKMAYARDRLINTKIEINHQLRIEDNE